MDDGVAGSILCFVILLLLKMLFNGFDSAFRDMRGAEMEETDGEDAGGSGAKQDRIAYLIGHQAQYAGAVQLGAVAVDLLFGAVYLDRLNSFIGSVVSYCGHDWDDVWYLRLSGVSCAVIATLLILYIIVTFGISIPRKSASRNPEGWLTFFITPVYYYVRLATPLSALISLTANGVLRLFGVNVSKDTSDVTEEEILSMVNVGHEQGIIHANEAEMINNIFEFGDKEAKDIMINRNNMVGIECTMTLQEAAAFIADEHNSRFPVYDGTIDHIVGILHLKDVMRMQMNEKMKNRPIGKIRGLLREPRFITEKRKLNDLFRVMQTEKVQMVIVIDEYGQTAGLVALEDILEEIVGNIEDEYDEEETYISESGSDGYVIQGMMPLEELGEQLSISFEEEPFDTVNGFVISRLEHIPEEGENFEFEYAGYTFRILEVKEHMIRTVMARKKAEGKTPEEQ